MPCHQLVTRLLAQQNHQTPPLAQCAVVALRFILHRRFTATTNNNHISGAITAIAIAAVGPVATRGSRHASDPRMATFGWRASDDGPRMV